MPAAKQTLLGPVLLLTSAMALLIVGCGEASMGSMTIAKGEFIRQADLICVAADFEQPEELEQFEARHRKQLEQMGTFGYESTVSRDLKIPSARKQIREIESLEVPPGEEREIGSIIARWRAIVRQGERNPYVFGIWWNEKDPFVAIKKVVLDYGFKGCEDLR